MPALPPVPLTFRILVLIGIGGARQGQIGYHLTYTGGAPTAGDCTALASSVNSNATAHFTGLMHPDYSLNGAIVTDINAPTGNTGEFLGVTVGTRTGTPLPANTAALIEHFIARRYRGGKPKSFWPLGDDTDLLSVGEFQGSFVTAVTAAHNAWTAGVLATTGLSVSLGQFVNVSYYEGVNPPITLPSGRVKQSPKLRTSPIIDPITSSSCRAKLGSQRRRLI